MNHDLCVAIWTKNLEVLDPIISSPLIYVMQFDRRWRSHPFRYSTLITLPLLQSGFNESPLQRVGVDVRPIIYQKA
jgi:hypothetical protein